MKEQWKDNAKKYVDENAKVNMAQERYQIKWPLRAQLIADITGGGVNTTVFQILDLNGTCVLECGSARPDQMRTFVQDINRLFVETGRLSNTLDLTQMDLEGLKTLNLNLQRQLDAQRRRAEGLAEIVKSWNAGNDEAKKAPADRPDPFDISDAEPASSETQPGLEQSAG